MSTSQIIKTARAMIAEHGAFAVQLADNHAKLHSYDGDRDGAIEWLRIAFTVRTLSQTAHG